jgi:PKD domain/Secretion system C-terminal sorting domain
VPSANAGSNQTITLPANSVTLTGTGSETGGTIVGYAWTQLSGPSTAAIGTAGQPATTVGGLMQGTYRFELTVTDNSGVTATATVQVIVNAAAVVPGAPSANAGGDQTITLPTNSVTLAGSGSETNGTIVSYAWTQVSGPSTASIGSAGQASTTVSALAQGVYKFKLTVTDNSGVTASDVVTVTVKPAAVVAGPPSANAGANQTIVLPTSSVTLSGSGSETNGTIVSYWWDQLSGPAPASFANASSAVTAVNGLAAGVYTFQLTVTDAQGVTATSTLTVTVKPHQPPVANAGPNQTTSLLSGVQLNGTGSYDLDGSIVAYSWIQLSGAGGVTIAQENTATPTLYGLTPGVYVFQLTVTDNAGETASATVTITVTANGSTDSTGSQSLVAVVNSDTTIYYPNGDTAILNGSASYATAGTITAYSWTQVSGPSTVAIANDGSSVGMITGIAPGNYVFMLTVTGSNGAQSTATTTVHVLDEQRTTDIIQMYPNPVQVGQQVTITGSNSFSGQVKFVIMDIGGRVVKTVFMDKQAPSFVETINVSGFSRGTYIIYMQFSSDKKPQALKLVVD